MTKFEHLAVLISIVIGLGITQLLTNIYQLVQARARVKTYWLPMFWAGVLFTAMVEWWWAFFAQRDRADWNFFWFLFVLVSPVTLFMASAFTLPDPEPGDDVIDMKSYYYGIRGYLFAMLAAGPALDAIRRATDAGSITDFGALTNAVSAVLVISLGYSKNEKYHVAIALLVSGLFMFFIVSTALRLK